VVLRDKNSNDYLQTIRESGEGPMRVVNKGKHQSPHRIDTSSSLDENYSAFESNHSEDSRLGGKAGHS